MGVFFISEKMASITEIHPNNYIKYTQEITEIHPNDYIKYTQEITEIHPNGYRNSPKRL